MVLNTKTEESSQFEQMKQIKDIIQKGEYPLSEQFMDVVRLSIKELKKYPYLRVNAGSVGELKLPVFLIYYFCETNTFEIFSKYEIDYLPIFTEDLCVNQPVLLGKSFIKKNLLSIYQNFLNNGDFPNIVTQY